MLETMSHQQNGKIQLVGGNMKEAQIQSSPKNSAILHVSKKDMVSIQTGDDSILSNGEEASLGRPDATTFVFEAGCTYSVLLNIEVKGSHCVKCTTQIMTQV